MREAGEDDEVWRKTYVRMQKDGSPHCPSPERLAALVLEDLQGSPREEIADHVVSCRRCSSAMKDLMELHRETARELPVRRPGRWWLGAAAALLIVGIGGPLLYMKTGRLPSGTPSSPRGQTSEEKGIEPADRATLAAPPARLAWPEVDDAEGYEVVLYDVESTPIWEGPVVLEARVALPEHVRASLRPGGDYYWRVTAIVAVERRPSALHRFHLAP